MASKDQNHDENIELTDETLVVRNSVGGIAPLRSGFRGSFKHVLDEKGRISFPATFRELLQGQGEQSVVLTNYLCDGARCLEGFSLKAWAEFEQKLSEKSRFDPQVVRLENFYLARAIECPIDSSGRINIPLHLRHYAGLEKEVVFAASLSGFRIWDARVWELVFQEAESELMQNPRLFVDVDKN